MAYSSNYFTEDELSCHCCGGFPAGGINDTLLEILDSIRENIGEPLEISCAYRCPNHNAEVGGVPNSDHVQGNAADVLQPNSLSWEDFVWHIHNNGIVDPEDMAIGYYPSQGFVHVGLRGYGCSWTEDD